MTCSFLEACCNGRLFIQTNCLAKNAAKSSIFFALFAAVQMTSFKSVKTHILYWVKDEMFSSVSTLKGQQTCLQLAHSSLFFVNL